MINNEFKKVTFSLEEDFSCNDADQVRGFTCKSETEYFEHSYCCTEVDECENGTHNCGDTEFCFDTAESFECGCGASHRRNPVTNECEPKFICPDGDCWTFDQVN